MSPKVNRVLRVVSKVVLVLTGLFLLGYGIYATYMGIRFKPYKVRVTNVTDSAFTVSWITDSPMTGIVYYSDKKVFLPGPLAWLGKRKAVDDRDYSDATSECVGKFNKKVAKTRDVNFTVDASGFNCNNVKVWKYGKYYTHHVTIKNLDAEKEYYFRVGDGYISYAKSHGGVFVEREMPAVSQFGQKTLPLITQVVSPIPAFGTSYNVYTREDGTMGDKKNFDSLIFLKTFKDGKEYPTMSAVSNTDGGWSIDLANIRTENSESVSVDGMSLEFIPQVDNAKPGASGSTLYEETEFPLRLIGNQLDNLKKMTSVNTLLNTVRENAYLKNLLDKVSFKGFTAEQCQESSDGREYCLCSDGKWRLKGTCSSDPVITYRTCWSDSCNSVSWRTDSSCPGNFPHEDKPNCDSPKERSYRCWQLGQDFMCRGVDIADRTCSGMFVSEEACQAAAPGQRCKDTKNIAKDDKIHRAGCEGAKKTCYYRYYHIPTGETCEYRRAEGENCGVVGCGDDGKRSIISWGAKCLDADGCTCGDSIGTRVNYQISCPDKPVAKICPSNWGTWSSSIRDGKMECVDSQLTCNRELCTTGCYTKSECEGSILSPTSQAEPQTKPSSPTTIVVQSQGVFPCDNERGCICMYPSNNKVSVNKGEYCGTISDKVRDQMEVFDELGKRSRICYDSDGCICIYNGKTRKIEMKEGCSVSSGELAVNTRFNLIKSEEDATVCCSLDLKNIPLSYSQKKIYTYRVKSDCKVYWAEEKDSSLCEESVITPIPVNNPREIGEEQYGCCKGYPVPISNGCQDGFDSEISSTCLSNLPKTAYCLPKEINLTGQLIKTYVGNCPKDAELVTFEQIIGHKPADKLNGKYCCLGGPKGYTLSETACKIGEFFNMAECIKYSWGGGSHNKHIAMDYSFSSYASEEGLGNESNKYLYYPGKGVYDVVLAKNLEEITLVSNGKQAYLFYYERNGVSGYQVPSDLSAPRDDEDLALDYSSVVVSLTANATVKDISLKRGVNIISFDFLPSLGRSEEKFNTNNFFEIVNAKGDVVSSISYFSGGQWNSGVTYDFEKKVTRGIPFELVFGKGYVIVAEKDATISVPGLDLQTPIPIAFSAGWNLVGVNGYKTAYTARSLIDSINTIEGLKANNVTYWPTEKSMYEGFQLTNGEEYGLDYSISPDLGYFVRISEYTKPECKSIWWNPGGNDNAKCDK